jgi:hypothetical protein
MKRILSLDALYSEGGGDVLEDGNAWNTKVGRKKNKLAISSSSGSSLVAPVTVTVSDARSGDAIPDRDCGMAEVCVKCKLACKAGSSVQCMFCDDWFHAKCGGLDTAAVAKHSALIVSLGWSCASCRADIRKMLGTSRAALGPSLAKVSINPLSSASLGIEPSSVSEGAPTAASSAASSAQVPNFSNLIDVERVVRKTVKDAQRRKNNVVVSGLSELQDSDDAAMFIDLCENHLNIKPRLASIGTRRLGLRQSVAGSKPRRLIVYLESESTASEILRGARFLRKSENDYISRNVYINPDIAPEEEKAAFGRRQAKRLQRESQSMLQGDGLQDATTSKPTTIHTFWNSSRPAHSRTAARPSGYLIDCTPSSSGGAHDPSVPPGGHSSTMANAFNVLSGNYGRDFPALVAPAPPLGPGTIHDVALRPVSSAEQSLGETSIPDGAASLVSQVRSAGSNVAAVPFVPAVQSSES